MQTGTQELGERVAALRDRYGRAVACRVNISRRPRRMPAAPLCSATDLRAIEAEAVLICRAQFLGFAG